MLLVKQRVQDFFILWYNYIIDYEGGDNMDYNKRKVSNIIMFLILFFMILRQIIGFSEFVFIYNTSMINDILFLIAIIVITVVLSILVIIAPILIIAKIEFDVRINIFSLPTIKQHCNRMIEKTIYSSVLYRKHNVIRC